MTAILPLLITGICAVIGAFAQVELKRGTDVLQFSLMPLLTNYHLIAGFALYGVGSVLYVYALKMGEYLSIIYPIIATSYIWVMFLAAYLFKEQIQAINWVGALLIVVGITLVVWR